MSGPKVRVERDGPVTVVVIARPEVKNAIDGDTSRLLAAAFKSFDADEAASVAVLFGEGGAFCAGADLKALASGTGPTLEASGDGPLGPTRLRLGKPVIAAIEGPAVAGGLELALWCDLRVAAEGATLGVLCRRWGVPLCDGGTVRLPRLVGLSRALDLILTGRPVGAEEALAMGLVHRIVPRGGARAAAKALAHELAALPQQCLRSDRLSAYEQEDLAFDAAMARETERGLEVVAGPEILAGVARFVAGAGRHGAGTP
jgi:enoyl-CoA hydratase